MDYAKEHNVDFLIDPKSGEILNVSTDKIKVVQRDHNSEQVIFGMPKLINGHDMSQCDKIEIHFTNCSSSNKADRSEDIHKVVDAEVVGDEQGFMIFSWPFTANATKFVGLLKFSVHFTCLQGEEITYEWNTLTYPGICVSETTDATESVMNTNPDILETWHKEVLADVEAVAGNAIDQAEAAVEKAEEAVKVVCNEAKADIEATAGNAIAQAEAAAKKAEEAAENVKVPRETLTGFASLKELKEAQKAVQDAFSTKKIIHSPSNTLFIEKGTRAELFAMSEKNLLRKPADYHDGYMTDCLNPLPAGNYVFYVYCRQGNVGEVNFMFKSRHDKTKANASDLDNLFVVTQGLIEFNTPHHFNAPDGIDFVSFEKNGNESVYPVLVREEDFEGVKAALLLQMDAQNLLPYPFQYDYAKSNVDRFDEKDGSPIIDCLKFRDLGNGCIEVSNITGKPTSRAINLYFHYGTEMQLPAGVYTFGCLTLRGADDTFMNAPWGKCRFIARWKDGDNESYYPETTYEDNTTSLRPVSPNEPITFNAYNGIGSISCSLRFSQGLKIPAGQTWKYIPHLCVGETQLWPPEEDGRWAVPDRHYTLGKSFIVYKSGSNLLRPASPRVYNSNINGTYIGTLGENGEASSNGVTIKAVGRGQYIIDGEAYEDTVFQINMGYNYMNPVGTLKFGNVPSNAPEGLSLKMRVKFSDSKFEDAIATKDGPATIHSTADRYMTCFMNSRIIIDAGTKCDNVLINWCLSLDDVEAFEPFKMPVAVAGAGPLCFDYFKAADATYIGNPSFNLSAKCWFPFEVQS